MSPIILILSILRIVNMKTGRRKNKCACRFDYRAGVALPVCYSSVSPIWSMSALVCGLCPRNST